MRYHFYLSKWQIFITEEPPFGPGFWRKGIFIHVAEIQEPSGGFQGSSHETVHVRPSNSASPLLRTCPSEKWNAAKGGTNTQGCSSPHCGAVMGSRSQNQPTARRSREAKSRTVLRQHRAVSPRRCGVLMGKGDYIPPLGGMGKGSHLRHVHWVCTTVCTMPVSAHAQERRPKGHSGYLWGVCKSKLLSFHNQTCILEKRKNNFQKWEC